MSKVSIIIPARAEKYENLKRTIDSIYENATGEFEVIVGFDGKVDRSLWGYVDASRNSSFVMFPSVVGIKTNINALAAMATGKYIYKSDAHCRFGKGFDEILQANMEEDWIVMPRFKIIKDDWSIQMRDGKEEFYDYFYLCCPFTDPRGLRFKAGGHWKERTIERLESHPVTDETPQIHGSGWFMSKDRYFTLGGFPNVDPYGHAQEPIWLALKNWLRGGKVMVNKKTWYAHLHQQGNKRGYPEDKEHTERTYKWTCEYWLCNADEECIHSFDWFVRKFMPMPSWPMDWEKTYATYLSVHP